MHKNKILRRDLKPDNIMIGNSGEIKLDVFGISIMFNTNDIQETYPQVGTMNYVSPELL